MRWVRDRIGVVLWKECLAALVKAEFEEEIVEGVRCPSEKG